MQSINLLNLITSVLGFTVALTLIFSGAQNRFVNRFLGIAFFVAALRSFSVYAVNENLSSNNFLIGTVSCFFYLIPACFYLYFRAVINDEQRLRKKDILHFLLPALAILLLVWYAIRSYVLLGHISLPENQTVLNDVSDFPGHIIPKIHAFIIFGISIIYLSASWLLVHRKLRQKSNEHLQVKMVRNWIMTLLITCTLLLIVLMYNVLMVLVFKISINQFVNPDIVRPLILIFIFTRVLFKPELLFGIPRIETGLPVVDQIPDALPGKTNKTAEPNKDLIPESKISRPQDERYFDENGWIDLSGVNSEIENRLSETAFIPVEKDKVAQYIGRINEYLENAPFTDPEFDMKTIADALDLPVYHLEFIFRYYNRYSFPEFRNLLRVRYVLKDLKSELPRNFTMEGIGAKAGFSSRSSFFRVFKSLTGKSPKQYLEFEEK